MMSLSHSETSVLLFRLERPKWESGQLDENPLVNGRIWSFFPNPVYINECLPNTEIVIIVVFILFPIFNLELLRINI